LGAGDAFSAGFIHSRLSGKPLAEACRFGNQLGALVATKRGGTTPVTEDEIEMMRQDRVPRRHHPKLATKGTRLVE
jgi:sugar/nucleoside kinase (ribokinase family)